MKISGGGVSINGKCQPASSKKINKQSSKMKRRRKRRKNNINKHGAAPAAR